MLLIVLELYREHDLTLFFDPEASGLSFLGPRLLDVLNVISQLLSGVFQLHMWGLGWQGGEWDWQGHWVVVVVVAFHCRGASWGRDIFKGLILEWFRGKRVGVVAIVDLLFEFLDTLESWQLLMDLDYLGGHYFVGRDQYLGIWEWLTQSSVSSVIKKLCLHLFDILNNFIRSPAVLTFTLLPIDFNLLPILWHLLLYVWVPLLAQIDDLPMIRLSSTHHRVVSVHLLTLLLLDPCHHLHRTVLLVDDKRGRVLVVIGRVQMLLMVVVGGWHFKFYERSGCSLLWTFY